MGVQEKQKVKTTKSINKAKNQQLRGTVSNRAK